MEGLELLCTVCNGSGIPPGVDCGYVESDGSWEPEVKCESCDGTGRRKLPEREPPLVHLARVEIGIRPRFWLSWTTREDGSLLTLEGRPGASEREVLSTVLRALFPGERGSVQYRVRRYPLLRAADLARLFGAADTSVVEPTTDGTSSLLKGA